MKALKDILKAPMMSEKTGMLKLTGNQIVFKVAPDANKIEIKQAIELRFNVSVVSVNTLNFLGKTKQQRGRMGRRPAWKKAVVRLKDGDVIQELE
jgi:large subunit ribosomal protein L23